MKINEYLPNYTLKDYKKWEGKWEMINGVPFLWEYKLPMEHQRTLHNILMNLPSEFDNKKGQHTTFQFDWVVNSNTVVCPDIVYVNKEITTDDFFSTTPIMIMEVISPNSEEKDRGLKFKLYEYEGVKYYIIVDPYKCSVEIYELRNREYALAKKTSDSEFIFDLEKQNAIVDFSLSWGGRESTENKWLDENKSSSKAK